MPGEASTVAPTPVVAPTVAPPPVEVNPKFAQRFATLATREQRLVQQGIDAKAAIAEAKTLRESVAQQIADATTKAQKELQDRYKADPKAFLKDFGSEYYQAVTKQVLAGDDDVPDNQIAALNTRLDRMTEEAKTKELEAQKANQTRIEQQKQEAIARHRQNIDAFVKSKKDTYELTAEMGDQGQDLIYQLMDRHYGDTQKATGKGEFLTMDEAAALAEQYYEGEVERIAKTAKFKTKWGQATAPTTETKPDPRPDAAPTKTEPAKGLSADEPAQRLVRTTADMTPRTTPAAHREPLVTVPETDLNPPMKRKILR